MKKYELIIFDCDGVLVDSERIANEVFARVLNEECGLSFSLQEMFETFVGHSSSGCMAIIAKMLGTEPPFHLEQRYKNEINSALLTSVTAVRGVERVIRDLAIPFCVASSGTHEKMRTTLGKTRLLHYFEGKLHSAAEVARGKPFPDVYLYAAKKMCAADPLNCLVIEDSPIGVAGGVAAGMTVFGYCDLMDEGRLLDAGAHRAFSDMSDLTGLIKHSGC